MVADVPPTTTMEYISPLDESLIIDIERVDFGVILKDACFVNPPEIVVEVITTREHPEGLEIPNELSPENDERREQYRMDVWENIVKGYLMHCVKIRWTPELREEVKKKRDIYGDKLGISDQMLFLRTIFTDHQKPEQLSALVNAIQGVVFFDKESASRMARMFQHHLWREGCFSSPNAPE